MEFFHSQETLTAVGWMLRAVTAFFFLVLVAKILGQRAISQLRLLDFVVALVIGNIIAHPLSDEQLGLKGSMITTSVLVALYLSGIFLILKWPRFRKMVNHAPITVVQNGEILYDGMKKAKVTIDMLLEELREAQINDISKVALAIWEANGKFSFFLQPQHNPLTPADSQLPTEPFDLPRIIIKEGQFNMEELQQASQGKEWVEKNLSNFHRTTVKNVLLATLDRNSQLKVLLYK